MQVTWTTDRNGHLVCDYFPYADGRTGSFGFDAPERRFWIDVHRYDLGQTCHFSFRGVRDYGIYFPCPDVVALVTVQSPELASQQGFGEGTPWAMVLPNIYPEDRARAAGLLPQDADKLLVVQLVGDMDTRIGLLCERMDLELS